MDNLSAQQKLMGNMQATSAELLSGIMEERGRGFASDREAWAQLKENIENLTDNAACGGELQSRPAVCGK